MSRKTIYDNFKKRFGDPARIEIEYAKDKIAPSEEAYQSEQISKAYAGVLKGILGREPTQNEIIGKTDIARHLKKRRNEKGD